MLFPSDGVGDVIAVADGSFVARCIDLSVLDGRTVPTATRTVLWSGSLAQAHSQGHPEDASLEPDARNWGASGWAALDAAAKRWVDAGLGSSLLVRTHSGHIVSDAPSATLFVRTWADHGVRLVYDLVSMITPRMVCSSGLADLHARRIDALLNPELSRGVAFVLVSNLRVDGNRVRPAPIDDGPLDPNLVRATIAICTDHGIATAVLASDRESNLRPVDAAPVPTPPTVHPTLRFARTEYTRLAPGSHP